MNILKLTSFVLALSPLATASAVTLWTTTFSGTNNTSGNASRTITNTPTGSFTDTLATTTATLTRNITAGNFFLTGTGTNFTHFNPNQNTDNAANAGWNAIFDFGAGAQTVDLSDVTFNIFRFNSTGAVQGSDALVRDVNISAEYTLDGGTNWTAFAATKLVNLTDSNTASATSLNIALNFAPAAPVTVDMASDDFRVRYTVLNANGNVGAFNAISSIEFNGTVVPEPSVALLGMIGALALLRRRRA